MESAIAQARLNKVIMYVVLSVMAFIMLVPFAWMILTAVKTNQEAISVDPFYIFPHNGWHWENFLEVWRSYNFLVLYKNTLLMILFRVICACLTATMAGYAFGRLNFPGKNIMFALVLIQMMIPSQIFIIPQYLMVSNLHLLDTTAGLVFPGIVTAFGTYLLKTGYQGLPKELQHRAAVPVHPDAADPFVHGVAGHFHRAVRLQGPDVAHDRLHQRQHHHALRRPCQNAGTVREQLPHDDGLRRPGCHSDDSDLYHFPEAVCRGYRNLGQQALSYTHERNKLQSMANGKLAREYIDYNNLYSRA